MTHKDSYNANSKVKNFGNFCDNWESEKEKLKDVKRSFMPNSDRQQFVRNSRTEFNPVTRKLTDYTEGEIDDTLDKMDELESTKESNRIKGYKSFIKENKDEKPGESVEGSKKIDISEEEVDLFSSEPSLQKLISDSKVSLIGKEVWYKESDNETKKVLDQYLEIKN
jgi:nucleoid DNA-binding protein